MKSRETAIDPISRSAARLRLAVFGAMVAMGALYLAARIGIRLGRAHFGFRLHGPSPSFIADASMVLLFFALFRLTQMLRLVAAGELFSAQVTARFRSFAFWLLLVSLLDLLGPFVSALISHWNARGIALAFAISVHEILSVGVTLLLFLLARLLERAREFEDEMREIV